MILVFPTEHEAKQKEGESVDGNGGVEWSCSPWAVEGRVLPAFRQ
jgi:hypothetical protein